MQVWKLRRSDVTVVSIQATNEKLQVNNTALYKMVGQSVIRFIIISSLLLTLGKVECKNVSHKQCKSTCDRQFKSCHSVNYAQAFQCLLDHGSCNENCYERRINTLQLRLVVLNSECGRRNQRDETEIHEIILLLLKTLNEIDLTYLIKSLFLEPCGSMGVLVVLLLKELQK